MGLRGLSSVGAAVTLVAASGSTAAARSVLPSPVPSWTRYSVDDGLARAAVIVPFRLYLAGVSPARELAFAQTVSQPGSSLFRHYVTPARFIQRFGPSRPETEAVEAWARANHLDVTGANSHYVAVRGSAPAVSRALATSIHGFGG